MSISCTLCCLWALHNSIATTPPLLLLPLPSLLPPVNCYFFHVCSHFHFALPWWCCTAVLSSCLHCCHYHLCHDCYLQLITSFCNHLHFAQHCVMRMLHASCCHAITNATTFAITNTSGWLLPSLFCSHFHFALQSAMMMLHGCCHHASTAVPPLLTPPPVVDCYLFFFAAFQFVLLWWCYMALLPPNHHCHCHLLPSLPPPVDCYFLQPISLYTALYHDNVAWQCCHHASTAHAADCCWLLPTSPPPQLLPKKLPAWPCSGCPSWF